MTPEDQIKALRLVAAESTLPALAVDKQYLCKSCRCTLFRILKPNWGYLWLQCVGCGRIPVKFQREHIENELSDD